MDPKNESSDASPDGESTANRESGAERDSVSERLRVLRLELEKTRSEAVAARLEARAKELELQIARLDRGETLDDEPLAPLPEKMRYDGEHKRSSRRPHVDCSSPAGDPDLVKPRDATQGAMDSWTDIAEVLAAGSVSPDAIHSTDSLAGDSSEATLSGSVVQAPTLPKPQIVTEATAQPSAPLLGKSQEELEALDCQEEDVAGRRAKPTVWMASAVFHAIVFLILAFWTISSRQPLDQVAIAGSFEATDEVQIENLEIQTETLEAEPETVQPSAIQDTISELGEIAVSDVIADVPGPPAPVVDAQSFSREMAAMSMKSDSDSKMQFCGVEGGGNHFVYLVDSSGSMGDAFESARTELLRSIQALTPEQRFYVIFFDAESDYMRISDPSEDESRSVYATPENKQRLARWAMTVSMDRGKAPYDAIPFALDLSPDVIFLLSDGEFPQRIEDMLKEINRVDNLFGDDGPISIIHTIGYHSREGETRMRRIAEQNGGKYRYVPEPG